MNRRNFLAAVSAGALTAARSARAAEAQITVLIDEQIGTISPLVHGHFVEHLGGVVYDGVWVGEGSSIPNVGGVRKALVDALRRINAPLFRWPGGCFADSYMWKDGVGPRANRPRRTNFWIDAIKKEASPGPSHYDPNSFGTDEFMRFCKAVGGAPYFAVNVRSASAQDFYDWVEYCNAPAGATTWSSLRGGEPHNVEFWGIGNESWGCGGDFTPEEYSVEFRKFTSWVPRFGKRLKYIAAGPNGADMNWSRGFFEGLSRKDRRLVNRVWGWGLHYYCGSTGKRNALDFPVDEYYQLLGSANRMESLITGHWAIMGEYDRERRVKFAVDEWGAWHGQGQEVPANFLFGYNSSVRDALVAGITMDIFHRHADKVAMANVAQLINCIHSLFVAYEDKFLVTPNYHVFDMYKAHHNGQAVRAVFGGVGSPKGAPGLAGSASLQGKTLVITATHAPHDKAQAAEIVVPGAKILKATADVLTADRPQAHNTFAQPDAVKPKPLNVQVNGNTIALTLPPTSVLRVTAELG